MLKGKTVQHATFGAGTIIEAKGDAVFVLFPGAGRRGATRKFLMDALFSDDIFPRALNAEVWATRGLDAAKRSRTMIRQNESDRMQQAIDLGGAPNKRHDPLG